MIKGDFFFTEVIFYYILYICTVKMCAMIIEDKIDSLARAGQYEMEGIGFGKVDQSLPPGVFYASCGGGKYMPLLRILSDNRCKYNCYYCPWRSSIDIERGYITPDELAKYFFELYQRRIVKGLFLSSAVWKSPDRSMEAIVGTAEILRQKGFKGYIHLKIIPGSSDSAIESAVRLASRVSINLEAPSSKRLSLLAPQKKFDSVLMDTLTRTVKIVEKINEKLRKKVKITTQYVVGPSDESDRELLHTTELLYRKTWVHRAYYSPFFIPDPESPLSNKEPTPWIRVARLYQADWLIKHYGFKVEELPFNDKGNLPLNIDPKLKWALDNPDYFPLEINKAEREELLRVPGLGPKAVSYILKTRVKERFKFPYQLKPITNRWKTAVNFLLFDGRKYTYPMQLELI